MAEPTATPTATEIEKTITQVQTDQALSDPKVPLEIKLETGQVYRAETPQGLLDQLKQAQENASKKIKQQGDEIEALKQRTAEPAVPATDPNTYDPNEYYKRWQTDPRDAQAYLDRFDPVKQDVLQTIQLQKANQEVEKFRAAVGGWQAKDTTEANAFVEEFSRSRLAPTAANYELVYRRMADENRISRVGISHIEGQPLPPPRTSSGGGGPAGFDMERFAQLPADQQERVIRQLEQQGYRR